MGKRDSEFRIPDKGKSLVSLVARFRLEMGKLDFGFKIPECGIRNPKSGILFISLTLHLIGYRLLYG
jgi:hypothetical protein